MLCSKIHCQHVFKLKLFSWKFSPPQPQEAVLLLQGYLAHKKQPPPSGPPYGSRLIAALRFLGGGHFLTGEGPLHCGSMVGSIKNAGALQLNNAAEDPLKQRGLGFSN